MNRTEMIGNLTDNPELKTTPTGKFVTDFTVAVNEGYGDKKTTTYIPCRVWEKTAENLANYCQKGDKIYVEGKFRTDTWEKDGKKNYKSYILVNTIEFLQTKPKETGYVPPTNIGVSVKPTADTRQDIEIDTEELPFY